jgi:hypothetical protein
VSESGDTNETIELTRGHRLRSAVVEELRKYGKDGEFLSSPQCLVLATTRNSKLQGFGVLHNLRDPARHPGTAFDMDAARELMAMHEVGLFRIALLHSCIGTDCVASLTEEVVRAADGSLAQRFERHALVIPLLENANGPAFPLFRRLDFKPKGIVSYCIEIDLRRHASRRPPACTPGHLEVVFMDCLGSPPVRGLSRCYAEVFLQASQYEGASAAVRGILDSSDFDPGLSLAVRTAESKEIVGFLLAERKERSDRANVTVVGLHKRHRCLSVLFHCFSLFASRCFERGVLTTTQITSRHKVVRLVRDRLGGQVTDRLIWLIRVR